jgi:hypothetical protein
MVTLHLGVLEQPYDNRQPRPAGKRRKGKAPRRSAVHGSISTGDVADILEAKYGVMGAFLETHGQEVGDLIATSMANSLEDLMRGAPSGGNSFASAESAIENAFKTFLSSGEAERAGISGVPTQAALKGVNHRLKHPYAKANPPRTSFIDTGLYENSFKAWVGLR